MTWTRSGDQLRRRPSSLEVSLGDPISIVQIRAPITRIFLGILASACCAITNAADTPVPHSERAADKVET